MIKYPAILMLLLMLPRLSAAEPLSGVVFGVSDTEIEILVSSGKMPVAGMEVEVFKSSDGVEDISIGTWSVTRTDVNMVYARPVDVLGTPQLGQKAVIGPVKPKPEPERTVEPLAEKTTPATVVPIAPATKQPAASPLLEKAPEKTTTSLSAADQSLMDGLASGDAVRIRTAAKYLYRGRYENPVVMDQAAEVLLEKYNEASRDAMHVDAMAWICKALWVSGEEKYLPALRTVESQSKSLKLRKYAFKYRCALEKNPH